MIWPVKVSWWWMITDRWFMWFPLKYFFSKCLSFSKKGTTSRTPQMVLCYKPLACQVSFKVFHIFFFSFFFLQNQLLKEGVGFTTHPFQPYENKNTNEEIVPKYSVRLFYPPSLVIGCVVGGTLTLDLPCGPVIGACHICRPIFGTPCRVWRAPSQLDSSWPAVPHGTGMPAPPMSPRRCHHWNCSPAERTEAETPRAWALTASTVQLYTTNTVSQSKQALLAPRF